MRGSGWMAALPIAATLVTSQQAEAAIACDVAGNLVANCGFEDSTVSPWSSAPLITAPGPVHTGSGSSGFDVPSGDAPTQTISGFQVGQVYSVSFWFRDYTQPTQVPFDLNVTLGSTALFTALNAPTAFVFTRFSTTYTATSTSAVLVFSGNTDGYGGIDDVVITARTTQDVPEPASLAVLGAGLAGLVGLRRRRRAA